MSARKPEELQELIEKALNEHNLDALVDLYEAGTALALPDGAMAHGKEGVRQAMGNFVGLKPVFKYSSKQVIQSDDIAMLAGKWTLKGTAPDGSNVEMAGQSAEVARKQADGTWLYIVDSPSGFTL